MESIEALRPDDIADAVAYIVTRDRRVAVNEILVRAAEQEWVAGRRHPTTEESCLTSQPSERPSNWCRPCGVRRGRWMQPVGGKWRRRSRPPRGPPRSP
jgi:hypothetical protein